MVRTFLVAAAILALGVIGMAVTIIVKPDGKFPDGEISHNRELRKRGVICAKEEELRLWGKKKRKTDHAPGVSCPETGCDGCAFNEIKKDQPES